MTIVTISAAYGAGGSVIGPRVAERLGATFVDRAVPAAVARELDISVDEATAIEENAPSRLWTMFASMAPLGTGMTASAPNDDARGERELIERSGTQIRKMADEGSCVFLGRAAAVVLSDHPDALHVRLTGSREGRIEAAMRQHGIDRDAATAAQKTNDRVRSGYITHNYGVDPADPALYHLLLDTVRLGWETAEELVVDAAGLLGRRFNTPG